MTRAWGLAAALAVSMSGAVVSGDDAQRLLGVDHFVRVTSTVPAIAGQPAQLYVRERVLAGTALRGPLASTNRVVLFVHGAGTPGRGVLRRAVSRTTAGWVHLARAGFDVFSVDMTGYGRSTRPAPMNDPCNLAADEQAQFIGSLLRRPASRRYPGAMTTIASDWDDVGAAVDYIRALRRVERVSLVAWSLGGPRCRRLRGAASREGEPAGAAGPRLQPQLAGGRAGQGAGRGRGVQHAVARRVRSPTGSVRSVARRSTSRRSPTRCGREMLASDPVGATWGPGVRRAPQTTTWGWNTAVGGEDADPDADGAAASTTSRSIPERVRELYDGPRRAAEGADRSRVRLAQRDVGKGRAHARSSAPRSSGSRRAR